MHEALMLIASRVNQFLSSAFDTTSVDMLVELGLDRFKDPSGESPIYLICVTWAGMAMPVILSTAWPPWARSKRH